MKPTMSSAINRDLPPNKCRIVRLRLLLRRLRLTDAAFFVGCVSRSAGRTGCTCPTACWRSSRPSRPRRSLRSSVTLITRLAPRVRRRYRRSKSGRQSASAITSSAGEAGMGAPRVVVWKEDPRFLLAAVTSYHYPFHRPR